MFHKLISIHKQKIIYKRLTIVLVLCVSYFILFNYFQRGLIIFIQKYCLLTKSWSLCALSSSVISMKEYLVQSEVGVYSEK